MTIDFGQVNNALGSVMTILLLAGTIANHFQGKTAKRIAEGAQKAVDIVKEVSATTQGLAVANSQRIDTHMSTTASTIGAVATAAIEAQRDSIPASTFDKLTATLSAMSTTPAAVDRPAAVPGPTVTDFAPPPLPPTSSN